MAKFTFKAADEYALKLSKLASQSERVTKKAIYAGAAIVADEIRKNIKALPETEDFPLGTAAVPVRGLTKDQKKGLLDGLGFALVKMDEKGMYNTQIGYEGYNSVRTKKFPNGQPNLLIARSVESGTSFREKTPFVRPAVKKTREKAMREIERVVDEEYEKIMGGK